MNSCRGLKVANTGEGYNKEPYCVIKCCDCLVMSIYDNIDIFIVHGYLFRRGAILSLVDSDSALHHVSDFITSFGNAWIKCVLP